MFCVYTKSVTFSLVYARNISGLMGSGLETVDWSDLQQYNNIYKYLR